MSPPFVRLNHRHQYVDPVLPLQTAAATRQYCNTCQENILEGDILKFKLADRPLKDDDRFAIKKGNAFLFSKRNKKQAGPGTVKNNELEFQNVNQSDAGTYDVETYDVQGNNIQKYTKVVCVHAKIPKPKVNMTSCQNERANFICIVESSKDLIYSWQKNGKKTIYNEVKLEKVEADNSKYTCTVGNPVHNATSDPVEAKCGKTLFGFDFWIMVSILAGGGGLVLLLTVVLVTVACRSCKRKEKQQRDEEEFRLNYLNTTPSNGQKKLKTTARGQPAPPEPYDNVSAHDVPCETESKPKNQPRARPPPPPEEDEEEPPPPLPQPRKKGHFPLIFLIKLPLIASHHMASCAPQNHSTLILPHITLSSQSESSVITPRDASKIIFLK
ncbi:T-cell surface antigen CD2-like [Clarias magur]|uniref:T-cell surface antigen CD2-like n=1 Tax=Clarias magur TaxID=1594786 RepID=A0A8J4UD30_CLAMG|nr:T-cell surface antigen CD2-like [Clarias magur]